MIIPVYNRPDEVDELLLSLARQERGCFEVIVVEDGSTDRCDGVVEKHSAQLDIRYFFKPNSGPGPTRNFGAGKSRGDWLLFLDSDCIVPAGWLGEIEAALDSGDADAFGGPDRAHGSFSTIQKAIDYSMTSPLTTGGMRGGGTSVCRFWPRSFNMGIRREVFERLGGFSDMRFGEDIDLSYRVAASGHTIRLFPAAWVWHKRRTCLVQFFRQIFNSGRARVALSRRHRGTLRPVHVLPALFVLCGFAMLILSFWWPWLLLIVGLFACLIFADAAARTRSVIVGGMAVAASIVQLTGYGTGFLKGLI